MVVHRAGEPIACTVGGHPQFYSCHAPPYNLPTPPALTSTRPAYLCHTNHFFFIFFFIVCFTSYIMFSCIAVLPHSPGVVYYHLLLRQETIIPGVAPFSFRIWDLFVHSGQKSYTTTAFGKLWTTPGVRNMPQHNP